MTRYATHPISDHNYKSTPKITPLVIYSPAGLPTLDTLLVEDRLLSDLYCTGSIGDRGALCTGIGAVGEHNWCWEDNELGEEKSSGWFTDPVKEKILVHLQRINRYLAKDILDAGIRVTIKCFGWLRSWSNHRTSHEACSSIGCLSTSKVAHGWTM